MDNVIFFRNCLLAEWQSEINLMDHNSIFGKSKTSHSINVKKEKSHKSVHFFFFFFFYIGNCIYLTHRYHCKLMDLLTLLVEAERSMLRWKSNKDMEILLLKLKNLLELWFLTSWHVDFRFNHIPPPNPKSF